VTAAGQQPKATSGRDAGVRHRRPIKEKVLISVEEAAELLGQSRSSLYRAIERDGLPLPVLKIGGRYRIPRISVERLIDGQTLPLSPDEASLPSARATARKAVPES